MGIIFNSIVYQGICLIFVYSIFLIPFQKSKAESNISSDSLKPLCLYYSIKDIKGDDLLISNFAILDNQIWVTGETDLVYCLKNGKQINYRFSNQSVGLLKNYEYDSNSDTNQRGITVAKIISGYKSVYFVTNNNGFVLRMQNDSIYNMKIPLDSNNKYSYFYHYYVDENDNLWMIYHDLETENNTLYCICNDSVQIVKKSVENIKELIIFNNLIYAYEYKYEGYDTKKYIAVYENEKLLCRKLLTNFSISQYNKFFRINDKIYLLNSVGDLCEISNKGRDIKYKKLNMNYLKHFSCFWLVVIGNNLLVSNIMGIQKINLINNENELFFSTSTNYYDFLIRDIQINGKNEIWGIYGGNFNCNYNVGSFYLLKLSKEN